MRLNLIVVVLQILGNVLAGFSLYLSQPFAEGDDVQLLGGGLPAGAQITGVVAQVQLLRTLLKSSDDVTVAIPNKTVVDMIIFNKSRQAQVPPLGSWTPRRLRFKVRMRSLTRQVGPRAKEEMRSAMQAALVEMGALATSDSLSLESFSYVDNGVLLLGQCKLRYGAPKKHAMLMKLVEVAQQHGGTLLSG